jgi:hypothetical protein
MNQLGLDLPGSVELSDQEQKEFRGGSWLSSAAWWSIAASLVSNFGDIREGFADGFAQKPPRY